ncbi:hypothetical protein ABK040_012408 [Willaertia magna]
MLEILALDELFLIYHFLTLREILNLSSTCKYLHQYTNNKFPIKTLLQNDETKEMIFNLINKKIEKYNNYSFNNYEIYVNKYWLKYYDKNINNISDLSLFFINTEKFIKSNNYKLFFVNKFQDDNDSISLYTLLYSISINLFIPIFFLIFYFILISLYLDEIIIIKNNIESLYIHLPFLIYLIYLFFTIPLKYLFIGRFPYISRFFTKQYKEELKDKNIFYFYDPIRKFYEKLKTKRKLLKQKRKIFNLQKNNLSITSNLNINNNYNSINNSSLLINNNNEIIEDEDELENQPLLFLQKKRNSTNHNNVSGMNEKQLVNLSSVSSSSSSSFSLEDTMESGNNNNNLLGFLSKSSPFLSNDFYPFYLNSFKNNLNNNNLNNNLNNNSLQQQSLQKKQEQLYFKINFLSFFMTFFCCRPYRSSEENADLGYFSVTFVVLHEIYFIFILLFIFVKNLFYFFEPYYTWFTIPIYFFEILIFIHLFILLLYHFEFKIKIIISIFIFLIIIHLIINLQIFLITIKLDHFPFINNTPWSLIFIPIEFLILIIFFILFIIGCIIHTSNNSHNGSDSFLKWSTLQFIITPIIIIIFSLSLLCFIVLLGLKLDGFLIFLNYYWIFLIPCISFIILFIYSIFLTIHFNLKNKYD